MALPQKHTVTANVQVTGGAARVIALQEAVKFASGTDFECEDVLVTARKFHEYLQGDGEDHAADVQQPGEGE